MNNPGTQQESDRFHFPNRVCLKCYAEVKRHNHSYKVKNEGSKLPCLEKHYIGNGAFQRFEEIDEAKILGIGHLIRKGRNIK